MSRTPNWPAAAAKEKRPGLVNRPSISRTLVNGLSDADKNNLLLDHTKTNADRKYLLQNITKPTILNGPSSSITAACLKRTASAPAPAKVIKVEKKPTVAPKIPPYDYKARFCDLLQKYSDVKDTSKEVTDDYEKFKESGSKIPPYDYKARFNDLLEKHRALKNEFNDLKVKHSEVADDYEEIKESGESSARERDMLKDKLLNTLNDLRNRTTALDSIKMDYEIQKRENAELVHKTKVLADVTSNLKKKTYDFDTLEAEFKYLTMRYNVLQEENKVLKAKSKKLATLSIDYDKLIVDYEEAKNHMKLL